MAVDGGLFQRVPKRFGLSVDRKYKWYNDNHFLIGSLLKYIVPDTKKGTIYPVIQCVNESHDIIVVFAWIVNRIQTL